MPSVQDIFESWVKRLAHIDIPPEGSQMIGKVVNMPEHTHEKHAAVDTVQGVSLPVQGENLGWSHVLESFS